MNRQALLHIVSDIRSSLGNGESSRNVVRALVLDHAALINENNRHWTLDLAGVRATGNSVNAQLLNAWCDAAEAKANRPRLRDLFPRFGVLGRRFRAEDRP